MDDNDTKKVSKNDPLPLPSSLDLRGRQSVRATFKLTGKAIDAISVVATHLGIKQKSLFDHLIDDTRSLNLIARNINSGRFKRLNRIQKTYVISRKTLYCLEEVSRDFSAPRDALVEYSIQRLLPVIAEEREKHQRRKEILDEITDYLKQGEKILERSKKLLGEDDPVFDKFKSSVTALYNAHRRIGSFIEKGEIIEKFVTI
jgi:hypothetical protein